MLKKLWAKLAALSIPAKVTATVVTVAVLSGGIIYGLNQYIDIPAIVDPQQGQQQHQEQQQQQDDDILDIEDVEEEKGVKKFWKKVKNTVTGGETVTETETPVVRYVVKFETNGGEEIGDKSVVAGTAISKLPTTYKEGSIFLGWFYDEELTQAVESEDKVNKNMTLYASWLEQTPLEILETSNFASAVDVSADFGIAVVSTEETMSAEEVMSFIVAKDLTSPDTETADIIAVSGSNGTYTIKGVGGFREGASYRISLNNDALSFKDQSETVREYNFTVFREEVQNLSMQSDIKYIPMDKISNIINNDQSVDSLNIALYEADGTNIAPADMSKGRFTYTDNVSISVGDTVCVYEGEIPTNRTAETPRDKMGDMAYLEITKVDGTTFCYKNADVEDVIFTPDILPMPETAEDLDDNPETLTVDNKYLDYSSDLYSQINLDSLTTVDEGDFLAFYSGEHGQFANDENSKLTGYGKITKVEENNNDTTTITFVTVNWEEVEESMALYAKQEMSAEEMLAGVDTEEMESQIEQQAMDSGFAEEAAQYLASLALATENFTALSDNMNLNDYKVTLTDGTPVSPEELQLMSDNLQVSIDKYDVKANISTHPTHLNDITGTRASRSGISINLNVKVVFTIDSADSEGQLQITVTGSFVEELGVDFNVDGYAVWDWAFIIPYISEYVATANIDVVNYTGVSFNATMITIENGSSASDAVNMANEIKALLKNRTNHEAESGSAQDKLVQRYSEMVNSSSGWIKVVNKNIFEAKINVPFGIPLIRIGFSVDFVVSMDASVSMGFDFEYIEGNRYAFTVEIFAGKTHSDTIVLKEKTYGFSFYTMGRLGIKAGLEMDFTVSLISDSVAAIGIGAEAGVITNLHGYFYYEFKYTASQGKTQSYSGALLIDVGVYMNAALKAEAIGGRYSARMTLFDKEWSLLDVGSAINVLEFNTQQKDMPQISLKQQIHSAKIPDSVFLMDTLDLITGESESYVYQDAFYAENYDITMTNKKFSYNPGSNTITVYPDEDDVSLDGEMIITWRRQSMSVTSKPIQRRISLHWDALRDGYFIVPDTNGGSYVPMIVKKYEEKVVKPADPEKLGYIFAGWYSDEALTVPYTFPELMPNKDIFVYAKWEAATDTPYKVEHYKEKLASGEYELVEFETFTGTTDSFVNPEPKTYTGYITPDNGEIQIKPDGSAVLCYYYNLENHNVTFDAGEAAGVDLTAEDVVYNLKYGAEISEPKIGVKGYTFAGWTTDGETKATVAQSMGTQDLVYTAMWEKEPDTEYRVEYYVQQTDGSYKLQHLFAKADYTGTVLYAEDLRNVVVDEETGKTADDNYTDGEGVKFGTMTVNGKVCEDGTATVTGDGKLVVKINYARAINNLTFDANGGTPTTVKSVYYQQAVDAPQNPIRTGYTFVGWDDLATEAVEAVSPITVMGTEDVTYSAMWVQNNYTVRFNKADDLAVGEMAVQGFTYDAEKQPLTANTFTKTHYDFAGWSTQKGGSVAYADEEAVNNLTAAQGGFVDLYAVWTPTNYSITYHNTEKATHTNPAQYNTETATFTLIPATRTGYTFDGWFNNAEFTGEAVTEITKGSGGNVELFAKWTARTDIPYKAEHYTQNLDGSWALAATDSYTGTSDTAVTPAVKAYTGFATPSAQTVNVAADGSTVVRYEYARNSYTLNFNANGGQLKEGEPASITAQYEAPITLPKTADREGYAFAGWYNGDSKFEASTMPAENLDISAKWEAGKYTYTVNHRKQNVDGNGFTVETETFTADMDQEVTPAIKTYEGFTSPTGAVTIKIGTDTSKNVVTYEYTRNQYDLSWNLDGGEVNAQYTDGKVYYGAPITVPVPEKTGYSYTWDKAPAATMPAENLAYKAIWTANSYTASFDLAGGTVENGDASPRTVVFDTAYGELPTLAKTGYTFKGWFTAAEGGTEIKAETLVSTAENHTLYAQYDLVTYTIEYVDALGGTHANETSYSVLTNGITIGNAEKPGYTFLGWYENGNKVTVIGAGTVGNRTLTATWQEHTYTVVFHSNNGQGNKAQQIFKYTDNKELSAKPENFTKAGYQFKGWSTSENGTVVYADGYKVTQLSADNNAVINLYAVWEEASYTISYKFINRSTNAELFGVVNSANNPTKYSVSDNNFALEPASITGYTFNGWYTDAEFTTAVTGPLTFSEYHNQTLYAMFIPVTYNVYYSLDMGQQPISGGIQTYGDTFALKTLETLYPSGYAGYTFLGWSTIEGGEVVYADGQSVTNLTSEKEITLHAVWKLNVCNIEYVLGSGADANALTNPASFGIKGITLLNGEEVTGSSVQLAAPAVRPGYEFLGWHDGNNYVDIIGQEAGEQYGTSRTLTAKWAHSGIYTIAPTAATLAGGPTNTEGFNATFTVTRTLPADAELSATEQTVWVRTQNGTAYGVVPEMANEAGQDKYHFVHTNPTKEGSGFLKFGPNSPDEQTITIVEKDQENWDYMPSSYRIGDVQRKYYVQIYDITSSGVDGVADEQNSTATRTLPLTDYELDTTLFYNWVTAQVYFEDGETKKEISRNGIKIEEFTLADVYGSAMGNYAANAKLLYNCQIDIKKESGLQQATKVYYQNGGREKQIGQITAERRETFNVDQLHSEYPLSVSFKGDYMMLPAKIVLNTWKFYLTDNSEPAQQYLAPMAFTQYKAGDEIYFTVVYNEIVCTADNVSFTLPEELAGKVSDISYVDGIGTNALVFKGKVTSPFKIDTTDPGDGTVIVKDTVFANSKNSVTGTVDNYEYQVK